MPIVSPAGRDLHLPATGNGCVRCAAAGTQARRRQQTLPDTSRHRKPRSSRGFLSQSGNRSKPWPRCLLPRPSRPLPPSLQRRPPAIRPCPGNPRHRQILRTDSAEAWTGSAETLKRFRRSLKRFRRSPKPFSRRIRLFPRRKRPLPRRPMPPRLGAVRRLRRIPASGQPPAQGQLESLGCFLLASFALVASSWNWYRVVAPPCAIFRPRLPVAGSVAVDLRTEPAKAPSLSWSMRRSPGPPTCS